MGYGNERIRMSTTQLKQLGYGTKEKPMPSDKCMTVDEWCETHPNIYKVVSKNLTRTEKNFKRTNYYTKGLLEKTKESSFP